MGVDEGTRPVWYNRFGLRMFSTLRMVRLGYALTKFYIMIMAAQINGRLLFFNRRRPERRHPWQS